MVKVKFNLPPDTTFLSSVLYEGVLHATSRYSLNYSYKEAEFKPEFLKEAFKDLRQEEYNNIRITLTGNDNINELLFKKFNIPVKIQNKTLRDTFKNLNENFNLLSIDKEEISLQQVERKGNILMDVNKKEEGISFQLLKTDRYTGFSSLETGYMDKQFTLYLSKELTLIALLGIHYSYVYTSRENNKDNIYFLFNSPDQISELLSKNDKNYINTILDLKENIKSAIRKILQKIYLPELILLELLFNIELVNKIRSGNLDKISTMLFRIKREGNTYKIYEVTPITVFKDSVFTEKIREYFRNSTDTFIKAISGFLKNSYVLNALGSFNMKRKIDEADNILRAVQNLYKFVILGDSQALYGFIRELWNAYNKTDEDSSAGKEYIKLIQSIPSWF